MNRSYFLISGCETTSRRDYPSHTAQSARTRTRIQVLGSTAHNQPSSRQTVSRQSRTCRIRSFTANSTPAATVLYWDYAFPFFLLGISLLCNHSGLYPVRAYACIPTWHHWIRRKDCAAPPWHPDNELSKCHGGIRGRRPAIFPLGSWHVEGFTAVIQKFGPSAYPGHVRRPPAASTGNWHMD